MSLSDLMQSMDYGPAREITDAALAWLDDHGRSFGQVIDGTFRPPRTDFETLNPATGATLARLSCATDADLDAALSAARAAQPGWARLGGPGRARHLRALAKTIRRHARLLAVIETLDTGMPIRQSRDSAVPLAARQFDDHAGLAQILSTELPDHMPLGVCGLIGPAHAPLLTLSRMLAPALAAGNTVVLHPSDDAPLSALLLAEICGEAGLPEGVVNLVTGDDGVTERLLSQDGIDQIAFAGPAEAGQRIRQATAGRGTRLNLLLTDKPAHIVFEDADLDSAVEGLVGAMCSALGPGYPGGGRAFLQEGIAGPVHEKLKARMARLHGGDPLDTRTDIGALARPQDRDRLVALVAAGTDDGEVFQAAGIVLPETGWFHPPTLVTGLSPAAPLMQADLPGPVLVSTTFRTPAEAVALANATRYGLTASVWSESVTVALDVARQVKAGLVWVNATGLFDAPLGYSARRESGSGREGGWDGPCAYLRIGTPDDKDAPAVPEKGAAPAVKGGVQDVAAAVAAARKAHGAWAARSGAARGRVLSAIAETLSAQAGDIAAHLQTAAEMSEAAARREVEAAIDRLFLYAALAGTGAGRVIDGGAGGVLLEQRAALGVMGILCPDGLPLLGPVSLLAPALGMGNACVLIPQEANALPASVLRRLFDDADVQQGLVGLVAGHHPDVAEPLAAHLDIDALWCFSSSDLAAGIACASAGNLKSTWAESGDRGAWLCRNAEGRAMLRAASSVTSIWLPSGA